MYAHRMAMSVTIVKMVNHTALRMRHDLDLPQIEAETEEGGSILYFLLKNESQPTDNDIYPDSRDSIDNNKTNSVFDLKEVFRTLEPCHGIASIINRVAEVNILFVI